MKQKRLPQQLPKSLHSFFWDSDPEQLNPSQKPYHVVNRLLDKGDLAAARWVVHNFPDEIIIQTFKKIRDFSPWNGRFWSRYFNIPEEEVACLQKPYLKRRKELWPF